MATCAAVLLVSFRLLRGQRNHVLNIDTAFNKWRSFISRCFFQRVRCQRALPLYLTDGVCCWLSAFLVVLLLRLLVLSSGGAVCCRLGYVLRADYG